MDVTRRTLTTTSASSGLPQDPMTIDPDVHVLATTRISTNPANPEGPINSTNITGLVDLANSSGPNEQPLPSRVDPPLVPQIEGLVNVEQPPRTTTDSSPQYNAGEIRLGIDEPHVDLGEDFELARLREVACQVGQTEEPHDVGCDAFAH
uniref:Uncharacterized protein n=1 Tax=Cannabis sativa TaxID=3483 RepID=A0A803QJS1_CANSA